jgi:hypothetical protein
VSSSFSLRPCSHAFLDSSRDIRTIALQATVPAAREAPERCSSRVHKTL